MSSTEQSSTREVNPLVSVVIPTYNHAAYVRDAVESVLNQHYPNYEIIVVDDGSTDATREVLLAYDGKIRYLYQENRGLSAARNTGIRAARGEYIGVLDADDRYEPEFLGEMAARLKGQPEAAAVHCGFRFVDGNNNPLPQVGIRMVPSDQFFTALLDGNFLVPECILVRRRCYQSVGGFDESLRACEDWDMWLRISRQYTIYGSDRLLIRHRILPGSMSTDPLRMLNNRLAVLEKLFARGEEASWKTEPARRRAFGRAYLATALEYLQSHDLETGFDCFSRAIALDASLLSQLEVFYELGCGAQPKGWRGDFTSLRLEENARLLDQWLGRLFAAESHAAHISRYSAVAYANTNLALGLLSYGAGNYQLARRFMPRALTWKPSLLLNRSFVITLCKAMLGKRVISYLKHLPATSHI